MTKCELILSIRDNGLGFNPATRPPKGGKSCSGLTGMAERANLLGGEFRVRPHLVRVLL